MKSRPSVISFSLAIIAAVACQPEETFGPSSTISAGDVKITATFEQPSADTKTSLEADGKVLWSAGDELAVMTPSTKDKFTLTSGAGSSSAEFYGPLSGSAPFCLLYPYFESCAVADGKLKFTLPQEQTVSGTGTFGQGASPAVAVMDDYNSPVQFRNLCGVLELSLCGSGINVSKIAVSDLGGMPLWGDCEVDLDGTQGTDGQKMDIRGGGNTVILNLARPVLLKASSATLFEMVVPAGSFRNGFSVKLYDLTKGRICVFSTRNAAAEIRRSGISTMKKFKITDEYIESADPAYRGYYKELFVDKGIGLSGVADPPASDSLGWSHDSFSGKDSALQRSVFAGNSDDLNGALLYPDGEPRYRMIYVNGGGAATHGTSLSAAGRKSIVDFVNAGGSYVGTCAGAFIASTGTAKKLYDEYLGIYPSRVHGMDYFDTCSNVTIPETSPLLGYYDFGGDLRIDSVYFNGGCYLSSDYKVKGTEILLRYYIQPGPNDSPMLPTQYHNQISAWAYKANDTKGRVVCTGSHPEGVKTGERLNMMEALCRYAVDGNGKITDKGALVNEQERKMDQLSSSGSRSFARIGDKQYHHFRIEIPAGGAKNLTVRLKSFEENRNLMLSLRKGDFAWRSDADYVLAYPGGDKTVSLDNVSEGTWYVSVFGSDAPKTSCSDGAFKYIGDKTLLNGIPYSVTATWE